MGLYSNAAMYAAMGLFIILASRLFSTLPINTPGVYDVIGNMDHVYGIRYISSSVLFLLAAGFGISAFFYIRDSPKRYTKWLGRIVGILKQPYIPIAIIAIAGIWAAQGFSSDGKLATFFAKWHGLDVTDPVDREHYEFIISNLPIMEFMFIGVTMLIVSPFSYYSSAVLLQDTGLRMKRRESRREPMDFERKTRRYATRGLFIGGIIYMFIGVVFFGIGYVMGVGINIGFGLFAMENYRMIMLVYPWFPWSFGIFCMVTSILYYRKPMNEIARICSWITFFIQMIIPIFGWFFGTILYRDLQFSAMKITSKDPALKSREKKRVILALIISAIVVGVPLLLLLLR